MNSGVTIERKRIDCNALPKGWQREEVLRKSGIAAGKVDVYYYSPTGKRIDSKPQLARFLGDAIDIMTFDFQSGKTIQHHLAPPPTPTPTPPPPSSVLTMYRCSGSGIDNGATSFNTNPHISNNNNNVNNTLNPTGATPTSGSANALKRKYKTNGGNNNTINNNVNSGCVATATTTNTTGSNVNNPTINPPRPQFDYSRPMRPDVSLVPPIRQTASIFKQPVTVVRNHESGKVKHDTTKQGASQSTHPQSQEKPKQLFWEKRLERSRACHAATGEQFDEIALPKGIRPIGPNVNEHTVLQSLATALHVLNMPVTGQASTKTEMIKNATAFINPEQPLMQSVLISDDDVRRQEERVNNARKKLQDALKV